MPRNVVITVYTVKMVSTVVKIVVKIVAMIVAKIGVSLLCQFLIFFIVSLVSGGFQFFSLVLLVSGGYQMPVKELWAEDSESNYNTTGYWEDCQPLSDCLAFA